MPMLGDDPYTGWASGFDSDSEPKYDAEKLERFTRERDALKAEGFESYSETSAQSKPCLYGLLETLKSLHPSEKKVWLDDTFQLQDVKVSYVGTRGWVSEWKAIRLAHENGKSVDITEIDLWKTDAFASVPRYHKTNTCPLYMMHKERVLQFIQQKYAELTAQ